MHQEAVSFRTKSQPTQVNGIGYYLRKSTTAKLLKLIVTETTKRNLRNVSISPIFVLSFEYNFFLKCADMMVRPHFKKILEGLNKLVSKGFSNENSRRRPSILCEAWKTNQWQSMAINANQCQSMPINGKQ